MTKNDEKQIKKEENQDEYQVLVLSTLNASIKLGVATANSVCKDGQGNGDVTKALEYAQTVANEQQKFVEKQGIKNLRI